MKLDPLQRAMRLFRALAPYNAIQMVTLAKPMEASRFGSVAEETVRALGLGRPVLSHGDRVATFEPIPFPGLAVPHGRLEDWLARELATPFANDTLPLRFFASESRCGVVYDHWLADSRSIRALLEDTLARYRFREPPSRSGNDRTDGARWTLDPFAALRSVARHRHAFRVPLANPLDFSTGVLLRDAPDGLTTALRETARTLDTTVHALFVGALAKALGIETARVREATPDRRDVGIGTIVDLRASDDDSFGMKLGSFTTLLARPEATLLPALVASSAAQARAGKRRARGSASLFKAALLFWRLAPTDRDRALLFHKNAPVTAALSNVDLTRSWAGTEAVVSYLRVSPAGPLAPMVVTPTTLGGRLNVCVTYRRTAFDTAAAERVTSGFLSLLASF